MQENLTIKLLDKSTIEQQVEAYRRSFNSHKSFDEVMDNWKKTHYENPVHESYIFGVFDGDKIVSINAYMPMKYKYKNLYSQPSNAV